MAENQTKLDDFSSNLPIVLIDTRGQSIVSVNKITAEMKVIYNGEGNRNFSTDPPNNYDGLIGIEIRGSSSQSFPKKQYGFETRDSLGNNNNVELLGFPSENDWILYAPYSDKSLLRNVIAYKLFNEMKHYASRTKFCEVFLKEKGTDYGYMGIYVLLEKIKRDKNRVKISEITATDISGDSLTGGYIIKIDKMDGEQIGYWTSSYPPYSGAWQKINYQYHYPKPDEIIPLQKSYLSGFIYQFEKMMASQTFNDTLSGYPKWMDIPSLIDFFILNEVTRNVDGFRLSSFMFKDRDSKDGKIYMGPVWDYNIALGNADYYNGWLTNGWQLEYFFTSTEFKQRDGAVPPFWWKKIFDDPLFKGKLKQRWLELRMDILKNDRLFSYIDSMVIFLDESQKRNFERWKILNSYIWPNAYIGFSYQNEIKYLKDWIKSRISWIDFALFGGPVDTTEQEIIPKDFSLEQNFPNPFNSETVIRYDISVGSNVKLSLFNILGEEITILFNKYHAPGKYNFRLNASGLNAGIYLYKIETGSFSSVKKLVYIK